MDASEAALEPSHQPSSTPAVETTETDTIDATGVEDTEIAQVDKSTDSPSMPEVVAAGEDVSSATDNVEPTSNAEPLLEDESGSTPEVIAQAEVEPVNDTTAELSLVESASQEKTLALDVLSPDSPDTARGIEELHPPTDSDHAVEDSTQQLEVTTASRTGGDENTEEVATPTHTDEHKITPPEVSPTTDLPPSVAGEPALDSKPTEEVEPTAGDLTDTTLAAATEEVAETVPRPPITDPEDNPLSEDASLDKAATIAPANFESLPGLVTAEVSKSRLSSEPTVYEASAEDAIIKQSEPAVPSEHAADLVITSAAVPETVPEKLLEDIPAPAAQMKSLEESAPESVIKQAAEPSLEEPATETIPLGTEATAEATQETAIDTVEKAAVAPSVTEPEQNEAVQAVPESSPSATAEEIAASDDSKQLKEVESGSQTVTPEELETPEESKEVVPEAPISAEPAQEAVNVAEHDMLPRDVVQDNEAVAESGVTEGEEIGASSAGEPAEVKSAEDTTVSDSVATTNEPPAEKADSGQEVVDQESATPDVNTEQLSIHEPAAINTAIEGVETSKPTAEDLAQPESAIEGALDAETVNGEAHENTIEAVAISETPAVSDPVSEASATEALGTEVAAPQEDITPKPTPDATATEAHDEEPAAPGPVVERALPEESATEVEVAANKPLDAAAGEVVPQEASSEAILESVQESIPEPAKEPAQEHEQEAVPIPNESVTEPVTEAPSEPATPTPVSFEDLSTEAVASADIEKSSPRPIQDSVQVSAVEKPAEESGLEFSPPPVVEPTGIDDVATETPTPESAAAEPVTELTAKPVDAGLGAGESADLDVVAVDEPAVETNVAEEVLAEPVVVAEGIIEPAVAEDIVEPTVAEDVVELEIAKDIVEPATDIATTAAEDVAGEPAATEPCVDEPAPEKVADEQAILEPVDQTVSEAAVAIDEPAAPEEQVLTAEEPTSLVEAIPKDISTEIQVVVEMVPDVPLAKDSVTEKPVLQDDVPSPAPELAIVKDVDTKQEDTQDPIVAVSAPEEAAEVVEPTDLPTLDDGSDFKASAVETVDSLDVSSPEEVAKSSVDTADIPGAEKGNDTAVDASKIAGMAVAAGGLAALAGVSMHSLATEAVDTPVAAESRQEQPLETRELAAEPEAVVGRDSGERALPAVDTIVPETAAPESKPVDDAVSELEVAAFHQPEAPAAAEMEQAQPDKLTADSLSEEYVLVEAVPSPGAEQVVAPPTEEPAVVEQSVISLDDGDKQAAQNDSTLADITPVTDAADVQATTVEDAVIVEAINAAEAEELAKTEVETLKAASEAESATEKAAVQPQAVAGEEPTLVVHETSDSEDPVLHAAEPKESQATESFGITESVDDTVDERESAAIVPSQAVVEATTAAAEHPDQLTPEPAQVSKDSDTQLEAIQTSDVLEATKEEVSASAVVEAISAPKSVAETLPVPSREPLDVNVPESINDAVIADAPVAEARADATEAKAVGEIPTVIEDEDVGEVAALEKSADISQPDAVPDAQPDAQSAQSPTHSPILAKSIPESIVPTDTVAALSPATEAAGETADSAVSPEVDAVLLAQRSASDSAVVGEVILNDISKETPPTTVIESAEAPALTPAVSDVVPIEKTVESSSVTDDITSEVSLDKTPAAPIAAPTELVAGEVVADVESKVTESTATGPENHAAPESTSHTEEIAIGAGIVGVLGVAAAVAANKLSSKEPEPPKTVELLEEYAARLDKSDDGVPSVAAASARSLDGDVRALSTESSQVVDEAVPLSESFHVVERDSPDREEAATSTKKKEASSESGEEIVAPSKVPGGIKTDEIPPSQRPPTPAQLFPRGFNTEFRVPTPAVVLPDLDDPLAKQMSRVRSIRRQRRNTIKQAEEMVAAAVVIYATAEVLSPPASPTLSTPPADGFGATEMHSDTERRDKGKGKDVETPVLPRQDSSAPGLEEESRGRTQSRDIGAVQEGELLSSVADLSVDDKGKTRDTPKTDDPKATPSSPRRHSHHSSRHRSHRESRDGSKEGSRHSHRRRSDSHTSSRSLADDKDKPRTPTRQDSGFSEHTSSSRTRKQRTPEEQEAHDKRKEERRRLRELEKAKEESAPSPTKERSATNGSTETREHHRHRSSRRHSRTSVEPAPEPSSPAASKKFFDLKNSKSIIESNFPPKDSKDAVVKDSKDAIAKEPSMPPSSSKTPTELKRSSTSRSARLRRSEDRGNRLHRSRDDVASSKAKETRESLASASKTRETFSSAAKTRESLASAAKTKESATSVGATGSTSSGDGDARHRARREERRKEREEKEKKTGIRAAIKRFFTN